jgi:uridine kinase
VAELWSATFNDLVGAIRDAAGSRRPVVLIDGRSGSGKTVLAQSLLAKSLTARSLTSRSLAPSLDAQLVSLDDVYPGWEGLKAGSDAVHETVLRARDPGWTRWDWASSASAEWHPLDPERALIVEGCGALSRANRALATFGIWLEVDAAERHRRFSDRDHGRFDRYWDGWAAQEQLLISREQPQELADVVLTSGGRQSEPRGGSNPPRG